MAAFPGATVETRPRTPVPDPPTPWTWSRPLPPRQAKASTRLRPSVPRWGEAQPDPDDDEPDLGRYGGGRIPLGRNPNACLHCGLNCDPRDLAGCSRSPDGRWEHLECFLRSERRR